MKKVVVMICATLLLSMGLVHAEEIILKNGDKVSGAILEDTANSIVVSSQALGTITIDRVFVKSPLFSEQKSPKEKVVEEQKAEWSRTISLGYSKSGGNTLKSEANGSLAMTRKTDNDEWGFRTSAYYSSADKKMDAQKYYGMTRYAFSFGEELKWFNFYKLEADHDRFSNIDYRVIPTTGFGYWFSDSDEWKLMAEIGAGVEYTNYRDDTSSNTDFVATPHGYLKKLLIKDLWFEQDLTYYLVPDDLSQYRLRSESSLIHQINEQLSWKFSFVDEYNANPGGDTKKNDYRLVYSIDYAF